MCVCVCVCVCVCIRSCTHTSATIGEWERSCAEGSTT